MSGFEVIRVTLRSFQTIKLAIRPDFPIIDNYFDKYRSQNDFKMQYCHSTILQCDPQVAGHYQSTIDHAYHVPIM